MSSNPDAKQKKRRRRKKKKKRAGDLKATYPVWNRTLKHLDSVIQGRALTKWFGARFSERKQIESMLRTKEIEERVQFIESWAQGGRGRLKSFNHNRVGKPPEEAPEPDSSEALEEFDGEIVDESEQKAVDPENIEDDDHIEPEQLIQALPDDESVRDAEEDPDAVSNADTDTFSADGDDVGEEEDDEDDEDDEVDEETQKAIDAMADLQDRQKKLPILSCFVEKQSPSGLKPWQKRYLAVYDYNVYYSKNAFNIDNIDLADEENKIHCLPLVTVNEVRVKGDKSRVFIVQARDPKYGKLREYKFRTSSPAETMMWTHGIQAHRHHLLDMLHFVSSSKSKSVEVKWKEDD